MEWESWLPTQEKHLFCKACGEKTLHGRKTMTMVGILVTSFFSCCTFLLIAPFMLFLLYPFRCRKCGAKYFGIHNLLVPETKRQAKKK